MRAERLGTWMPWFIPCSGLGWEFQAGRILGDSLMPRLGGGVSCGPALAHSDITG